MLNIIEHVIKQHLEGKEYDQAQARPQVENIVRQIQAQVKLLSLPSYKIVVQAVIG